ncbi:MAG: hypothetical protein JEZ08_25200 [Clostridiales bacterium]|nr:hypothetical protein [Clostridiales bacterium]
MLFIFVSVLNISCTNEVLVSDDHTETNKLNVIKKDINEYFDNANMFTSDDIQSLINILEILDSDIYGKEIIFTAESHGIKDNQILEIEFIKYFKKKNDFKYLLCEIPYSDSHYINKYLETEDETILNDLYSGVNLTDYSSKEQYNVWIQINELNKTLSDNDKIKVIGVDIESNIINAYRFLVDILPAKDAPEKIKPQIMLVKETLDMVETTFTKDYIAEKNAKLILEDIEENLDLYEEYFGENLVYFELVNQNIVNSKEAYKYNSNFIEFSKYRDKMIYDNFLVLDEVLPKGKYYGQWGYSHALQSIEGDKLWFGTYLNSNESTYKGKVLSIVYNYEDCIKMGTGGRKDFEYNFIYPFINEITDKHTSKYTLYKLNGNEADRPFIPMIDKFTGEELDQDINQFLQYVLLIRESVASESLD